MRELEDLIIETIYTGLCQGKLNQVKSEFHIDESLGRDVQQSELDEYINKLSNWREQSDMLIKSIEDKMDWATKYNESSLKEKKEFEGKCDDIKKKIDELTELSRRSER